MKWRGQMWNWKGFPGKGEYTDLTFEAESGSIHSAPNYDFQDLSRGFRL